MIGMRRAAATMLLGGMAACGNGGGATPDPAATSFPAEPTLVAVEAARFGGAVSGEGDLTSVTAAVPLEDGRFLVGDAARRLLLFDSAATPLGELGRPGEGPGEFSYAVGVGTLGDSIWVSDMMQRRVSLFAPDGGFVRAMSARTEFGEAPYDPFSPIVALWPGGHRVVFPNAAPGRADEVGPTVPWVLTDSQGVVLDTLGRSAASTRAFRTPWGTYAGQPFPPPPWVGVSGAGRFVEASVAADSARFRLALRIGDRDRVRVDTLAFAMPPVDAAWVDSILGERTASFKETLDRFEGVDAPSTSEIASALRDATYRPRWTPPIRGVRVADDGSLWLEGTTTGPERPWYRLDREGRPDGYLVLPTTHEVRAVTRDRLWVVTVDDLGVPLITVFTVREGGV